MKVGSSFKLRTAAPFNDVIVDVLSLYLRLCADRTVDTTLEEVVMRKVFRGTTDEPYPDTPIHFT